MNGMLRSKKACCPHCNRWVDYLVERAMLAVYYELFIDSDGCEEFRDSVWPSESSDEESTYSCPECEEVVAELYSDAVAFLKGEKGKGR